MTVLVSLSNKMLLCAEMHAAAKMANLAKIRQRVGENSNEISGGAPCKVANLKKVANLTKVANLANSCAPWT